MDPDALLLRRYAESRDQAAFAELVRRHLDGVYSSALRRLGGDTHLAEDVAQKVFVELARQARFLSKHPALTGWLYTTTRHHAANTVRTEQRRKARERSAHAMNDPVSREETSDGWSRLAPALDWAIDQLTATDRTAVLLRFIDRKSFLEIGGVLCVSDDAARMRVDRALEKLRTLLARRGVVSSAVALGSEISAHATVTAPAPLAASIDAAVLISGAATLSPLALVFHLMTTSKIGGAAVAAALLLPAFGTAIHELRADEQTASALRAASAQHLTTGAKLREIKDRLQTVTSRTTALAKQQHDRSHASIQADAEGKQTAVATWDPDAEGKAFLERHPEVKQALLDYRKSKNAYHWGALYRALAFTSEQIQAFEELIDSGFWFGRALEDGANNYVRLPAGQQLPAGEFSRRLKELLGKTGENVFREISEQQGARDLVTQTASALIFSDHPLTTRQSAELVVLLTRRRLPAKNQSRSSFKWEEVMSEAKSLLSPAQLSVLAGMRTRDEFQQAYSEATKRAIQPLANAGSTATKPGR